MDRILKGAIGLIVVTCLSMALSGCNQARGPLFEKKTIPDGKGVIYIYQEPSTGPIAITTPIYAYDKPFVVMRDGGYYAYFAHPGKTQIWGSQGKASAITVDVKEGQESYVRCRYTIGKIRQHEGKAQIHLEIVPNDVGQMRIRKCKKLTN